MDPVIRAGVTWHEWSAGAFARARAGRRPVLLSVTAPWSAACAAMDAECFGDAATAALVNERTIPVRVDAEHRPDIAERYDLGGLPSTVFLDAAGRVLGGGTFVPADRLRAALARLADVDLDGATDSPHGHPGPDAAGDPSPDLEACVFSAFDAVNGGFGTAPKFPLTAPVRLAIELHHEQPREPLLACAVRTLDAMAWGPLYDEAGGGFHRCAAGADWSAPQAEKLLAPNVALLDLYLGAGVTLGQERWLERAADVVRFVNRAMGAANGAWRSAEAAEPARQFTDGNAAAASAMLHAAAVFDDADLGRRAIEALERVLLASYRPGQGVAHSGAGVRGLLADQVGMASACLDAWEATGNVVYRMMAEELMHYAARTMWSGGTGVFRDRTAELDEADPVASAAIEPFVLNCEAAIVLDRIARAIGDEGFRGLAQQVIATLGPRAARFGPLAAHYLLARRSVLR